MITLVQSALLREHFFVFGLPSAAVELLASAAELVSVGPRTMLVQAGEPSRSSFILHSGHATVVDQGRVLRPGAAFGVGPVLGEPEGATIMTSGEAELLSWTTAALEPVLAEWPELRAALATRLSLRTRVDEIVTLLRQGGPFAGATEAQVRWLVEAGALVPVEAGACILEEGSRAEVLGVVVRGEVAIARKEGESSRVVANLRRGACFGEVSVLSGRPATGTVTVAREGEIFAVRGDEVRALVRESDDLRRALWGLSSERTGIAQPLATRRIRTLVVVDRTGRSREVCSRLIAEALGDTAGLSVSVCDAHDDVHEGQPDIRIVSVSGADEAEQMQRLAPRADAAVVFTDARTPGLPRWAAAIRAVHVVNVSPIHTESAVRADGGAHTVNLRASIGDLDRGLIGLNLGARRAMEHLGRALLRRRVGIALGGGAAWGYAHCALLPALLRAKIPIDAVAGVSFGSLAAAVYASRGLDGIDALIDARVELLCVAVACTVTTTAADLFVRRHVKHDLIEALPLPFRAVAVDIGHGMERTFRDGRLASAVRASCALPGLYATTVIDGVRYVDACVKNNVPTSALADCVDFVIACNVVPPPIRQRSGPTPGPIRRSIEGISPFARVRDGVRAMYVLANDSGVRQSAAAHATFSPDLSAFLPTDFLRARAIVSSTEQALASFLPTVVDQYTAFCRRDAGP